jgi:pimeloyl-ACP methyl ester carboxylesterase
VAGDCLLHSSYIYAGTYRITVNSDGPGNTIIHMQDGAQFYLNELHFMGETSSPVGTLLDITSSSNQFTYYGDFQFTGLNEKNLDLAQAIRRDGWDVVSFDYRGAWGSPGDFSFTHSIEDTQSAIACLRDPAHASKLRSDPAYLVLIGHSMGGFMARYAGAQDSAIKAVGLISAADMGVDKVQSLKPAQEKEATARLAAHFAAESMAPLAGCTPESLAEEVITNAAAWNVPNLAPKLTSRPVLVITSDDGLAPSNDAFVAALHKAGATDISTVHLTTDHSYSDQRIALEKAVLEALEYLQHK